MTLRLILVMMIVLQSCSRKLETCQTENGFGSLELGMSRNDFELTFPKLKMLDPTKGAYHFSSLKISDNIILEDVQLDFSNEKILFDDELVSIEANYNETIFNLLKIKNGIAYKHRTNNEEFIAFKTRSDDLSCMYFSNYKKPRIGFSNMAAMGFRR